MTAPGDIPRMLSAHELERWLLDTEWSYITTSISGPESTLCLICPFCSAMVPPIGAIGADFRRHHIRYHVDIWRQIGRAGQP
jgi:hypothetical protein